ncbi:MAG: DUF3365 domain-containing protein [Deltaproteobacteria bacterium]|nr:MAG: DUF3365 domain-containing protein [Deltaproteobacteria bacterium]
MKRLGAAAAAAALMWTVGAGCKGDDAAKPASDDAQAGAVTRAQAALKPLKQGLMKAVSEAMANGGPEAAIAVCRDEAPKIAAAASTGGVVVGRTSAKLRNPKNAPQAWLAPILAEYGEAAPDARPVHKVVTLGEGRFGYAEPIAVGDVCTKCHGTDIAPGIQAKLAELYPEDKATGYASGDLRGLFWAEVGPVTD